MQYSLRSLLLFLLALFARESLTGQRANWQVTAITVDDGLSQDEVTSLLQDRDGFLWVGTRGGLNRFSGQDVDVFRHEFGNATSLSNNSVECLAEDSLGRIWVGTKSGGISVFDPLSETFTNYRARSGALDGLTDNRIISLFIPDHRYVWVGTWEGGTLRYDRQSGSFERLHPHLRTYAFARHPDGSLWGATEAGLARFSTDGKRLNIMGRSPGANTAVLDLAYHPPTGSFLTGSWNHGVRSYYPATDTWVTYRPSQTARSTRGADNCYRIQVAPDNSCWVSTWGGGLYQFHPATGRFARFALQPGFARQVVLDSYHTRDGRFWVGTNGGGLLRVENNRGRFAVRGSSGLPAESVWAVAAVPDGELWVGTKGSGEAYRQPADDSSFVRYSPNWQQSELNVTPGIRDFHYDATEGHLFAATNYGPIVRTPAGFRPVAVNTVYDSLPRTITHVTALYRDRGGYYWIGTQQRGLWRSTEVGDFATVPFRQYYADHRPGSLRSSRITGFYEDGTGTLWITTYNGLHRYRPGSDDFDVHLHHPDRPESLSSDIILSAAVDASGQLWLGTPNGLNRLDRKGRRTSFHHLDETNGLSSNYIQALEADGYGYLWAGTIRGLTRISIRDGEATRFDRSDGLPSNSFVENASARGPDGTLYFGTQAGLVSFRPERIMTDRQPPVTVLRDLQLYNRSLPVIDTAAVTGGGNEPTLARASEYLDGIELAHDQNVLTVEYAALDFGAPATISYAYRLLGVNEEWTEAGRQRSVTFANLAPGDYRFQVRAARSGRDYGPVRELSISVAPPWYATGLAFGLYGLLVGAALYGYRGFLRRRNELHNRLALARLSQQKEAEMAETKARFFTNITHELRTPLTLITAPVAELLDRFPEGRHHELVAVIDRHAQRLLTLVNQLLDFRRVESDRLQLQAAAGNFVPFLHEVTLSFREAARQRQVELRFLSPEGPVELTYDRNQLEIVCCNLLSNAVKYAPASTVITVELREAADDRVEIRVADAGPGMPEELAERIFDRYYQIANAESTRLVGTGIGLALARSIVEAHHGTLTVETAPGVGSTFIVSLPRGQDHFSADELIPDFHSSEAALHYNPPRPLPPVASAPTGNHLPSILVVEDNPDIRTFLHRLLVAEYRVYEATNGREALDQLQKTVPDLVLSDVMMPEMDGLSLCARIRESERFAHLPVVLLTARTATVHQVDGYAHGADAYVTKPFRPAVLRARIAALLTNRRRLRDHFARRVTLTPTDVVLGDEDAEWIDGALQYVESHLDEADLSREAVATALHMSDSSFYRKLKALTGQTFTGFVRALRLKRAAQLLRDSDRNVSQIAFDCGFNDLKYFRACFRKQFGANPSDYREREASPAVQP